MCSAVLRAAGDAGACRVLSVRGRQDQVRAPPSSHAPRGAPTPLHGATLSSLVCPLRPRLVTLAAQPPNATQLALDLEWHVAATYGCEVRVVTLQPRRQADTLSAGKGHVTVLAEPMQLGPSYDQYSQPPTFTLPGLLRQLLKPNET